MSQVSPTYYQCASDASPAHHHTHSPRYTAHRASDTIPSHAVPTKADDNGSQTEKDGAQSDNSTRPKNTDRTTSRSQSPSP